MTPPVEPRPAIDDDGPFHDFDLFDVERIARVAADSRARRR